MIVGAAIVLLAVNARLALFAGAGDAADRDPDLASSRTACSRSRASCRQRKGDLTEATDEAVVGIEMVQAFGREDDVRDALPRPRRGGPARDDARRPSVEARFLPGLLFLPTLGDRRRAALRRPRRDRRRADDRRVHALHHAAAAARLAARGARLDHQPRPARGRVGRPQLRLARRDRAAARAGRPAAAARRAARASASRTSTSPTAPRPRCCAASTSRSSRARSSPSAARPAPARRRC